MIIHVLTATLLALSGPPHDTDTPARLEALAPGANPEVLRVALQARDCAIASGLATDSRRLAVIDYAMPSTVPRLWVFDLAGPSLLYVEHVTHGRGSGGNIATEFSNREGSHQTSLGLFATAETYQGINGYSLRLDGLEPGINDLARPRAIVIHGAWYADPALAQEQGRLGRSYGCPALRSEIAQQVIDDIKHGQLLFAWHPDWNDLTQLADCTAVTISKQALLNRETNAMRLP